MCSCIMFLQNFLQIIDSMAFKPSDSAPNPVLLHYKDQLKLNKTFKIFTRNYQLAYVGLNTAKEQIKSPISESECV